MSKRVLNLFPLALLVCTFIFSFVYQSNNAYAHTTNIQTVDGTYTLYDSNRAAIGQVTILAADSIVGVYNEYITLTGGWEVPNADGTVSTFSNRSYTISGYASVNGGDDTQSVELYNSNTDVYWSEDIIFHGKNSVTVQPAAIDPCANGACVL